MGVPLDTLRDISFEDYKKTPMMSRSNFFGTDLAILKLTNPLPETTGFPSFCEDNQSFSNTYGLSIGFGTLKFNWQDKGPVEVTNDPMLLNRRHVLSCKVSSQTAFDDCIFVGSYKGLLINGNESFIPKTGMMKFIPKTRMMKTEGLPVGGSGGGPLFVKRGSNYELVGIFSGTFSGCQEVIRDVSLRKSLGSYSQGVFPCWVDIRPHLEWIKGHMGEN